MLLRRHISLLPADRHLPDEMADATRIYIIAATRMPFRLIVVDAASRSLTSRPRRVRFSRDAVCLDSFDTCAAVLYFAAAFGRAFCRIDEAATALYAAVSA